MALSPKVYTWLCGCFAALGSILFGYDLGIIASVLPSETFLDTVGHPSDNEIGLITSLFLLGAFFGSAPSGVIADAIGRRKAIVVGCIVFIIGGTLQTAAQSLRMMMAGRFLAGWGVGQLAHLAPLFQSEIAHSSIRGRLTTLQQFFLGIGAFIASFIGYGCYNRLHGTQAQWRLPLGLQLFPAIPLALLIHAFPESPRWLAMKGRHEEALLCLARLHANGDTSDVFVQSELADIKASIEKDRQESENAWSLLFFEPSNRRRLILGIVLQFSVQMTGVSAIQYYAPAIFQEVGFDAGKTLLFQSINSVIALFGEAACVLLVDRLGRRWPLISANILSSSTFVIGTAIIAIYPADPDDPSGGNRSAHYAFVVMTWIFNLAFSAAIGPISWAYPVEIFGSATRARGTAITSMAAWIANFMIAQVTPIAFHNIGWKYYLVFAICGYTNALTFWAFFPETKGRKLEEMDEFFKHSDWFVPTAKFTPISATQRENEMRAGNAFGGEDIIDSDSKERIDRTEKFLSISNQVCG
ncbi:MFS sugar transporter [Rhizoctonia solani 123E]|uniref:MFS sugar transporter n=1 Tax=Rhizoctonia solani 123E TaxID=1423351 RepID=A0A074S8W5_9AGAM|nr:MFS sugar transporter [Rhizoctonia solani 123E]